MIMPANECVIPNLTLLVQERPGAAILSPRWQRHDTAHGAGHGSHVPDDEFRTCLPRGGLHGQVIDAPYILHNVTPA